MASNSAGAVKAIVSDQGYVGIGRTNPAYALDVLASGTGVIARFNSANATGCTLATDGTLSCTSDVRLKKNIEPLTPGLETLMSLRPVEYNWQYQSDVDTKNLGFIAQEVESLIPELVATDGNGYKSLNMIGMVPLVVKSVQEQESKIAGISLSVSTNATSLGTLKLSVDEEISATNSALKELQDRLVEAEGKIASLNSSVGTPEDGSNASSSGSVSSSDSISLEDAVKGIQDRLLAVETANKTLLDFYDHLEFGDIPVVIGGKLDLGDVVVTVKDLRAKGSVEADSGDVKTLTVGAIAVENADKEAKMIGTATLCPKASEDKDDDGNDDCSGEPMESDAVKNRDGKHLFIPTAGITPTSRVFITAKTDIGVPLSVTSMNATSTDDAPLLGFTVSIKSPLDPPEPIEFDWMIVNEK